MLVWNHFGNFYIYLANSGQFLKQLQSANSTEHHSAVHPHLKEEDALSMMEIIMNLSSQHLHSAGF